MKTKEERLARDRAKVRWCVHILGPDELIATKDYDAAEKRATELRDLVYGEMPDLDVMWLPIVAIWPYSDESHEAALDAPSDGRSR
jgi:hypothetical protein